ncbi:unnamed protein product [Didymodactylos carnosus]|nr:unnamed protein product [Didymodactylos carnosus]CAF3678296.1 unnamed protein product [Didymodactylos carnosus]
MHHSTIPEEHTFKRQSDSVYVHGGKSRSETNLEVTTKIRGQIKQLEKKEQCLFDEEKQLKRYITNAHSTCANQRKLLEQFEIQLNDEKRVSNEMEKELDSLKRQLNYLKRNDNDMNINERNYLQLSLEALDQQIQITRQKLSVNDRKHTLPGIKSNDTKQEIDSTESKIHDVTTKIHELLIKNNRLMDQQKKISVKSHLDLLTAMIEQINMILQTTLDGQLLSTRHLQQFKNMLLSNQEQLAALRNEVDDDNDQTTRNFQKLQRLQEQLGLLRVKMHDLEHHKRMEREKNDNAQEVSTQIGALQQHLERLNDQRQRVIKEIEYIEHKIQVKKNEI